MSKRLGKGLGALISETDYNNELDVDFSKESIEQLKIDVCRPNPYQPRKTFDADAIEELKTSILEYGIIQPLIVRKSIKGYEIVAGERRYRAAKEAGLSTVPAVVKEYDDSLMMEIALLENLQREDLTVIEEAIAYRNLMKELNFTQEDLSEKLGKSRSHIANTVRLLHLPEEVIMYMSNGELSMGHGRALLGLKNKGNIIPLAKQIRTKHLNVRQVEHLINELNSDKHKEKTIVGKEDIFLKEQAMRLRDRLGTNVKIKRNKDKGKIEIDFYSNEELENIISFLNK